MAATPLTIQTISRAGVEPATEPAGDNTNGNSVANNGAVWLEATNGGGSAATVTVAIPGKVEGQTVPAKSYSIAASKKQRLGPFPVALYGASLLVTPSAATVTLSAWQLST